MKWNRTLLGFLLIAPAAFPPAAADIVVADYPEVLVEGDLGTNRRSALYSVTVEQGTDSREAYVMVDRNQEPEGNLALNPDHHWSGFSISGAVKVVIRRRDGKPLEAATVYPRKKGIVARVADGAARLEITDADLPLQLWVDVGGPEREPLFLFADPLETDPPDRWAVATAVVEPGEPIAEVRAKLLGPATTVVFAEGIHRWEGGTGEGYEGYRLPIVSGKRIHIPGGAYVVGTFSGDNQSDWRIDGRGVLSGCGLERRPGVAGIPFSMVHATGEGARNQRVEGIVSVCSPHFHLTFRGRVAIDNVKMFGWWHQTDGTVTGDFSTVTNCFFKVMDDFIKVYGNHCLHRNNTMFQGVNGAPFQFSWGNQNGDHNVMLDTYVVFSVVKPLGETGNTAVINARRGRAGNVTENNFWDGLTIENGCHRLIGIEANGGVYRHFTLRNVEILSGKQDRPQFADSYLVDGAFGDFDFVNLTINGRVVTGADEEGDRPEKGLFWMRGHSNAVTFHPPVGEWNLP